MNRIFNKLTQPQAQYKIFNNPEVLPKAWYITLKCKQLRKLEVKAVIIGGQKLILYRGKSGQAYALDAFCPHMGTSLAIGTVVNEHIRCYFHHWCFDGEGQCVHIPAQPEKSTQIKTTGYAVKEAYGYIWVYPDIHPNAPLLVPPDLANDETVFSMDKPVRALCHHHIRMINGLDAQHLKFIHKLDIHLKLELHEETERINFTLSGKIPNRSLGQKLARFLLGPSYSYSMSYAQGSVASLTLMQDVYFIKPEWSWPRLHMIFAYLPGQDSISSYSYPIFITKKRSTLAGKILAKFLLFAVKRAYYHLRDDDNKIYDNIRFNTKNLLPIDETLIKYINYVEGLEPSAWSKQERKIHEQ